jgi:hypothetical protein
VVSNVDVIGSSNDLPDELKSVDGSEYLIQVDNT